METALQIFFQKHYRTIETERFVLRPLTLKDAPAMYAYTSCPDNFKYLKKSTHTTIEEDDAFLRKVVNSYKTYSDFIWGISRKENLSLIGTCRLFNFHLDDQNAEVSYMIHPAFQRQGVATEAVKALISYCFEELGFVRVQARCVAGNIGSERVMQKSGMQYEGLLRASAKIHGRFEDFKLYAILNDKMENDT